MVAATNHRARVWLMLVAAPALWSPVRPAAADEALAIFEQRVLPILQSPRASSCTECHLSGVELSSYVFPSQEKTFASLVAAGLIDTKQPEQSKLLTFIRRASDKPSLVTQRVRAQELAAFEAWIKAAVHDRKLLATKDAAAPIGPQLPPEVIRHGRRDRVLASFVENIWAEVARCAACHSPDRNQKQVAEHGERVSWIALADPQATLAHLVDEELIDVEHPAESLILAKPTLAVDHGGGQKMLVGDRTYKQFRRFIDDYVASKNGAYATSNELPQPAGEVALASEIWLKIEGVPARFDKKLLQADVYARTGQGWASQRVATSDRAVYGPKNLWQHSLSVTAPRDTPRGRELLAGKVATLPAGEYLVRVYVDDAGKLQNDLTYALGEHEFVGEVVLNTRWPAGYQNMSIVQFPRK